MVLNEKIKKIHCMGVGGIGVSGLAEILLKKGYQITGSDLSNNQNTQRLQALGAEIYLGHAGEQIQQADLAIYSSAISKDNPEWLAAQEAGIPLLSRGELLADMMRAYQSFAVAGTHGKTTTAGLISYLLLTAKLDPSFVVGGIMQDRESPAYLGKSPYFVAESDESDASFLWMNPTYAILTNIDADHLETYQGNFSQLKLAFINFLNKIPSQGAAIVCRDDPTIREILPFCQCPFITYGFADADYTAKNFRQAELKSFFQVQRKSGEVLSLSLNIPGRHNVLNALAVVAIADILNISNEFLMAALNNFPGMKRRFQTHGEMVLAKGKALVLEDYGHHPNEVKATLEAARLAWPNRRIVMVFQPHRFTRTRDLMQEFAATLAKADKIILLDIYHAQESPIEGIHAETLVKLIQARTKNPVIYMSTITLLATQLMNELETNDVVILQGAGDIGSMASQLVR